jgi:hypothetical protein
MEVKKDFLRWSVVMLVLFLVVISAAASGPDFYGVEMGGFPTSCCNVGDQEQNASGALSAVANGSSTKWVATKFLATDTYSVCKLVVPIQKNNSTSQSITITFKIYNNSCVTCDRSDDKPGTQVGGDSNSKSRDNLQASVREETFAFPGTKPSITSGNYYWVVTYNSDTNGSNYWQWQNTDSGVTEDVKKSADGTTWETESATISFRWVLYK